jgi:hypothetical protein
MSPIPLTTSWCLGLAAVLGDVQAMQSRGSPGWAGWGPRGASAYPSTRRQTWFSLQGGKLGFIGPQVLGKMDRALGPECDPGGSNM